MNAVDHIAKRNADAEVSAILEELMRDFDGADAGWLKSWGPRFRSALVGTGDAPEYTADQIRRAFDELLIGWKYSSPPKVAHLLEIARDYRPLKPMQKAHTDPTPQRHWSPKELAANIAKIEAMQAFLDSQEPEFREVLGRYGYGSAELLAVQARHRAELQKFIQKCN